MPLEAHSIIIIIIIITTIIITSAGSASLLHLLSVSNTTQTQPPLRLSPFSEHVPSTDVGASRPDRQGPSDCVLSKLRAAHLRFLQAIIRPQLDPTATRKTFAIEQ
jgi:hypothetical protein